MIDQLRGLAASLTAPVRHIGSDVAQDIVERLVIGAFAAIAGVFLLAAATTWLAIRHGLLTATLVMAGLFAALAILALLARVARSRARRRRRRLEQARAQAALATAAQAAAVATDLGALARRANPWVLVAAALAAGYAGVRSTRS